MKPIEVNKQDIALARIAFVAFLTVVIALVCVLVKGCQTRNESNSPSTAVVQNIDMMKVFEQTNMVILIRNVDESGARARLMRD